MLNHPCFEFIFYDSDSDFINVTDSDLINKQKQHAMEQ